MAAFSGKAEITRGGVQWKRLELHVAAFSGKAEIFRGEVQWKGLN